MVGRYILLNNNKIYDLHDTKDVKAYDTVKGSSHDDFKVKKSSNNILDLVEVGDLVKGDTRCIFASEVTAIHDDEIEALFHTFYKVNIDTIWKRQPNGDFKKYEVKAWNIT